MARLDTFTFRITPEEGEMIAALANKLQRSRSDSVRLLVRLTVESNYHPLKELNDLVDENRMLKRQLQQALANGREAIE